MNKQEQKLIDTVNSLGDEIIDFTARLAGEPSTLGNEQSVLRVMESEMKKLGFAPEKVAIDKDKLAKHPGFAPVPWEYDPDKNYNLAAVKKAAGDGGKTTVFNGHLDVVSPKPMEQWDTDPFTPVVKDGWMYARGAGDMKAGVAAMTYALGCVEKAGFGLKADATLEAVIDEECSGNGAVAVLNAGYDAEAVLIPEPFSPTILTSEVGVMWFKVAIKGKSSHVLATRAGANAIERCFPLMRALRELEQEMNETPRPAEWKDVNHPINLNIGIVQGGDWASTVPAAAEFHCRLSFFPDEDFASARKRVQACVDKCAKDDDWLRENPPVVEFYGFRSDGHTIAADAPQLSLLARCHQDLTGKKPDEYLCTCTTDLRAFFCYGQARGTCYGPVAERIHAANEKVNLESIVHTARAYALFLARWNGLAE